MKKYAFLLSLKSLAVNVAADAAGGLLIGAATYNFAAAADLPLAGVNGIALIFYQLWEFPIGRMAMLMNIPIALVCFRILGRDFFLRSLRTILITSLIMDYVAPLLPLYTGDRLLACLSTGVLSGLGLAIIYMRDSSTGGTDFILLSLKAKHPHMSLGKLTLLLDCSVIFFSVLLVSRNIDGPIYGLISTYLASTVMDKVLYGLHAGKLTMIVTKDPPGAAREISRITGRGATFLKGVGSYSGQPRDVLLCACNNKEMYQIRRAVLALDPAAFLIILDSNEVVGEGFLPK